jgi:hypothetical protein
MELGTTIVGILVLLICIIPFAMVGYRSKLNNKKKLEELIAFAKEKKGNITIHEQWRNSAIGLDKQNEMIFYFHQENETKIFHQILLQEIESCNINNVNSNISNKGNNYKIIEKIELVFSYQDKKLEKIALNIFNSKSEGLTVSGELQIAEKWHQLINEILKSNK